MNCTSMFSLCSKNRCRRLQAPLVTTSGGYCAIGPVRPTNDDLVFASDDCHLSVVLDGVGGHEGGAEASRLVLDELKQGIEGMCGRDDVTDRKALLESIVRDALHAAISTMAKIGEINGALEDMGTVFALAYVDGNSLFFTHVGDCRVYLFRKGRLQQLTTDETLVQLMVEQGSISSKDLKHHPFRSMISNGVGVGKLKVKPSVDSIPLKEGDTILLTSDGVTDFVESPRLTELLSIEASEGEVARKIVEAAYTNTSTDNASCIVQRVVRQPAMTADLTTGELRKELAKLRHTLRDYEDDIAEMAGDIEHALELNNMHQVRELRQRFIDSLLRLETRHPHVTSAVSAVSSMLASLGI